MFIQSSSVSLLATQLKTTSSSIKESLKIWTGERPDFESSNTKKFSNGARLDSLKLSESSILKVFQPAQTLAANTQAAETKEEPKPEPVQTVPVKLDRHDFGYNTPSYKQVPVATNDSVNNIDSAKNTAASNNNASTITSAHPLQNNNVTQQQTPVNQILDQLRNMGIEFPNSFLNGMTKPFKIESNLNGAQIANEITKKASENSDLEIDSSLDPELQIIKFLFEKMTGEKIKILSAKDFSDVNESAQKAAEQISKAQENSKKQITVLQGNIPTDTNYNIEYNRQVTHIKTETTSLSANGVVKTADGTEINFTLSLQMQKEFIEQRNININIGQGNVKDPLVVNFNGDAAQLTDKKIQFDIDADGVTDNIPTLSPGSGYLVYDRNSDGKINDGSELFGARTGDGFKELAAFDNDKNGWLDEADFIYNSLKIWEKDLAGKDNLYTLKQKSVGAIYLQNVQTPFDLGFDPYKNLGEIVSSSIYLKDSGEAGSVQQINVVV